MIQHLDSLSLLALLLMTESQKESQRRHKKREYSIKNLCDTAYAIEKQQKNILFDMDNASLVYSQRVCNNEILIENGYVIIPDTHAQHLKRVLDAKKPSQEIVEMILTHN